MADGEEVLYVQNGRETKKPVIQRTKYDHLNDKYITHFEHYSVGERGSGGYHVGSGGAVTAFDMRGGHYALALEWYDGIEGRPRKIITHLETPVLAERDGRTAKMIRSVFSAKENKPDSHISEIHKTDDEFEQYVDHSHTTKYLTEQEKQDKMNEIRQEIGKPYKYSLSAGFKGMRLSSDEEVQNCQTWAYSMLD